MTPDERSQLEDWLSRLGENSLTDEEQERLARALANDREARRMLRAHDGFTVDLAEALQADHDSRTIVTRRRRRLLGLLSSTGVAAALIALLVQRPWREAQESQARREGTYEGLPGRPTTVPFSPIPPAPTTPPPAAGIIVESRYGAVRVNDDPNTLDLATDRSFPRQGILRTEAGATATLRFPNRIRTTVGARAIVAAGEPGVSPLLRVQRGLVSVDVPGDVGETVTLATPLGHVTTTGAAPALFEVRAGAQFSRVDVAAGEVLFVRARDGQHAKIGRGQHALVLPEGSFRPQGPSAPVLVVVGIHLEETGDREVQDRLEDLGFETQVVGDRQLTMKHLEGVAAVYFSSSTQAPNIRSKPQLKSLRIPVICAERSLLDDLGFVPRHYEALLATDQTHVELRSPPLSLSGGLSGRVRVSGVAARIGTVEVHLPGAIEIASLPGRPRHLAMFAYDRGAPTPAGPAASRRVATLLESNTTATLTDEGWALFDAAVLWALSRNSSPDPE